MSQKTEPLIQVLLLELFGSFSDCEGTNPNRRFLNRRFKVPEQVY